MHTLHYLSTFTSDSIIFLSQVQRISVSLKRALCFLLLCGQYQSVCFFHAIIMLKWLRTPVNNDLRALLSFSCTERAEIWSSHTLLLWWAIFRPLQEEWSTVEVLWSRKKIDAEGGGLHYFCHFKSPLPLLPSHGDQICEEERLLYLCRVAKFTRVIWKAGKSRF